MTISSVAPAPTPQKRKRFVLSIRQKLEICDRARDLSRVWDWKVGCVRYHQSEDKLKTFQSQLQNEDCTKKRCIVRTADFPAVDKAVFLWFVQERAVGVLVSGPALMAKAALMYRELHPEDVTCEKFNYNNYIVL